MRCVHYLSFWVFIVYCQKLRFKGTGEGVSLVFSCAIFVRFSYLNANATRLSRSACYPKTYDRRYYYKYGFWNLSMPRDVDYGSMCDVIIMLRKWQELLKLFFKQKLVLSSSFCFGYYNIVLLICIVHFLK